MIRTVIDIGAVALAEREIRDELLTFAGLDTFVAGTIIARQLCATAITPSAVTGTGNGTVTAASVVAGTEVPKLGNWVLRCKVAATNGGTFSLEDPDGNIRGTVTLTAGSGGANPFKVAGIAFTINDGGTDFAVGDLFTLPVLTGSNKCVPFALAGAGGAQRPVGVLTYDVSRATAGDTPIRLLTSGKVKKERLIIDLDGTGVNVSPAVLDQLRAAGIEAENTKQLATLDN
jgi:hypothetical protein